MSDSRRYIDDSDGSAKSSQSPRSSGRFSGFKSQDEASRRVGDASETMDLAASDRRCYEIYILHRDGGYTFDRHGRLGAITKQERVQFFRGYEIEQKRSRQQQMGGSASKGASAGDRSAFDDYVDRTKRGEFESTTPPNHSG